MSYAFIVSSDRLQFFLVIYFQKILKAFIIFTELRLPPVLDWDTKISLTRSFLVPCGKPSR